MKHLKKLITICIIAILGVTLTACGSNNSSTLAKNIDNSVTDFVYTVSSMDWANDDLVTGLNTSSNQTNDNSITQTQLQNETNLNQNSESTNKNKVSNKNNSNSYIVSFTTENIINRNSDIQNKITYLIQRRSIIMLYINDQAMYLFSMITQHLKNKDEVTCI